MATMFTKRRLLSPVTGSAVPLSAVPDEAFSQGLLGEGFAVEPRDGVVYAPIGGRIESVTDTLHAYSIHTDDGLDVLVHIGVDTVSLGGQGFSALVSPGDRVRAGDVIARADLNAIRAAGLAVITPVIVANPDELRGFALTLGEVQGGRTTVMTYKI